MRQMLTTVGIVSAILVGCSGESEKKEMPPEPPPTNIVVILDTSDRVSAKKRPEQIQKDIEITKNIVDFFEELVAKKSYIGSKHTLFFVVPEQQGVPPIPQKIIADLKIWLEGEERIKGAPEFKRKKEAVLAAIDTLYQRIGNQNTFTGSDIWLWFRDSAEVYLKPDYRNYIVCLSDGYLDFNADIQAKRSKRGNKANYIPYRQVAKFRDTSNWKQKFHDEGHGLLETGKDFSAYDVKFLMVEITYRDMFDLEIIKEYWRTWLESMRNCRC